MQTKFEEATPLLTITDIWPLASVLPGRSELFGYSSTQNSYGLPFVNDEMTFAAKLHVAEAACVL